MDPSLAIAIYAAVVSTIVLLVQIAEFGRGRDQLKLSIATGIPIGSARAVTSDHIVQVAVAEHLLPSLLRFPHAQSQPAQSSSWLLEPWRQLSVQCSARLRRTMLPLFQPHGSFLQLSATILAGMG